MSGWEGGDSGAKRTKKRSGKGAGRGGAGEARGRGGRGAQLEAEATCATTRAHKEGTSGTTRTRPAGVVGRMAVCVRKEVFVLRMVCGENG